MMSSIKFRAYMIFDLAKAFSRGYRDNGAILQFHIFPVITSRYGFIYDGWFKMIILFGSSN